MCSISGKWHEQESSASFSIYTFFIPVLWSWWFPCGGHFLGGLGKLLGGTGGTRSPPVMACLAPLHGTRGSAFFTKIKVMTPRHSLGLGLET